MRTVIVLTIGVAAALALSGCVTGYTLVPSGAVQVSQGAMTVHPTGAWNKRPNAPGGIAQVEAWTRNGPVLDGVYFTGALPDGAAIVKQRGKEDRQVPVFHASMTPQDLVSMIESAYRIRGAKIFDTTGVKPVSFLGQQGVQFDFNYVGDDSVRRRGRSMIAVAGGKLYVMTLDGTALHYFDASRPEFEAMAASATLH